MLKADDAPISCIAELQALLPEANRGNQAVIAKLQRFLDDHPEVWRSVGDLADHVQSDLIRMMAKGNKLTEESIRRKLAEFRAELSSPHSSRLEKMAVERVLAAWLELQYIELKYPPDAGKEFAMARYVLQLKSAAQRQFDAATKSLLLVKEKLPVLRVVDKPSAAKRRKIIKLPSRAG